MLWLVWNCGWLMNLWLVDEIDWFSRKLKICFGNICYLLTFGLFPLPFYGSYICLLYWSSVSKTNMYNLLQPRMDSLLFEIIFPLMCFNDDDQKLWDEDPHEYVRKGYGKLFGSLIFLMILHINCYLLQW